MKRTATTNSLKTLLLINMKTKRIKTTNSSMKFSVYLPDECWELVFKNLLMDDQDYNSLSLVSKQFLSPTVFDPLSLSNPIKQPNKFSISFEDSPNSPPSTYVAVATSITFSADSLLSNLDSSLKLSNISTIPASGLLAFSITSTLNSLTCSYTNFLHSTHMFLIGNCFSTLQRIDLSHCKDIYADNICLLFMGCWDNITHLNLTACIFSEDFTRNFEVPKLKVLNLSYSSVDDRTLYAITKGCIGILKLSLKHCDEVGYKGVKRVLRNCKQLREINLKHCPRVVDDINVDSMLLLRSSLRKIKLPSGVAWVAPLVSTKS